MNFDKKLFYSEVDKGNTKMKLKIIGATNNIEMIMSVKLNCITQVNIQYNVIVTVIKML